MIDNIRRLMEHETAGDPITGLKWTKKTTAKIAEELALIGIDVCSNTVAKLLKKMDFSLKVNYKNITAGDNDNRDAQFNYISEIKQRFFEDAKPVISIDSKKRELVGCFKNPGKTWTKESVQVNDHDFPSQAKGVALPYGIYDLQANRGSVFVGSTHDTPQFAAESVAKWWLYDGRHRYSNINHLLILADGGGSNGYRTRLWKKTLQEKVCDKYGISISVSHYPSGCSKWNPIEHRLFCEISKNWAGKPLNSYETILNYIRTTTTRTGLRVKAYLVKKKFEKGIKVSDREMKELAITQQDSLPQWNYTIHPR